jgi:glycosyltransferase involved in cell wall biosynthesis
MYRCIANSTSSFFLFENRSDLNLFVSSHILSIKRAVQIAGAGVDIYKYFPKSEPDAACIKVLFAARLLKEKGLDDLVCAVKSLQNRGCIIRIYVAGIHDEADPDAIPFSQICEWQEEGYLQWLGTRNDMSNVIGDCHIVCLPTRYAEGTPRILIEGASCGRPLIAPNVPGCNEIIEDGINGLLYAKSGSPSLVDCLSILAVSPSTRYRMGVAGRHKVERCYSHHKVVSSTLEVYSALCL